jgi:hypothetical protein
MKFKDALQHSVKMIGSHEFKERVIEEDKKMLKYIPFLQKINKYGFLTTDSQAGHKTSGVSTEDGKPYQIEERAYIFGFMLEEKAADFIRDISIFTDKNAIYVPISKEDNILSSKFDIPLTINTAEKPVRVHTHMSPIIPSSVFEMYRKGSHIDKSEKVVYIFCWDPQWKRNATSPKGLFTDVLKVLQPKK